MAVTSLWDTVNTSALWERIENKTNRNRDDYRQLGMYRNIPLARGTVVWATAHPLFNGAIPANHMRQNATQWKIIAAQYPCSDSTKREFTLFWHALYQNHNRPLIIDLTFPPRDQMPSYYPIQEGETLRDVLNTVRIKLQNVDLIQRGTFDSYQIEIPDSPSKLVQRYHYLNWPDGTAISLEHLIDLVNLVEEKSSSKEILVHCRGGVGRTGTLIAALLIKERIENGTMRRENLSEDLEKLILELREDRNHLVVQTPAQFELLVQYAESLFHEKENGHSFVEIPD